MEDKMVKITSEKQNKVKRMKRTEDSLRNLWDNIKQYQTHQLQGSQQMKRKRKGMRKFLKRLQLKSISTWKENSQSSPRGTKGPKQDKPKEKQAKTHTNQTNKD